ncbi:MAG: type IV pilus modification PilV family protein, partial [Gemmatimonadales bacterium]
MQARLVDRVARRGRRRRGEPERYAERQAGFALLEVAIAAAFLCTVMVGIGSVLGTEMVTTTASSSWKVANALLNQAMEEVRALPSTTLDSGISDLTTCDSAAPGGTSADANIHVSGSTWTYTANNETLPHGDLPCSSTIPPVIPHQSTTTLNHLPFTVDVYPTLPTGMPTGIVRVTAVVTWHKIGLAGVHSISAQTLVYPTTCIAPGNNAFAGPCQALVSAGAGANTGGSIQVKGTIAGITFDQLLDVLPQASSSLQIQQISTVHGCAATSGGQSVISGAAATPTGESKACSAADNDPGSSTSTSQSNTTGAQSSATLTLSGSLLGTLGISLASGDTATSTSTVSASNSSPTCADLAGTVQNTAQPCGNSAVTSSGSASVNLTPASALLGSFGSAPLLSVTGSSGPASAFVARYTSGASYCDSPSATSSDGCVHAGAARSLGTVALAGLPTGLLGSVLGGGLGLAPTGWGLGSANCPAGNYLVALVNYSDSATAESGIEGAAPATSHTGTPYLCYWNGSGYTSTSAVLGSSSPSLPINNGSFSFTNLLDTVSVSVSTSLSMGTATTAASPSPWATNTSSTCWQSPCTSSATITSPIVG